MPPQKKVISQRAPLENFIFVLFSEMARYEAMRKGEKKYERGDAWVRWVQYPEDVLDMIKLLVHYFNGDSEKGLTPTYNSALKRAHKILGCCTRHTGDYEGRRLLQYLGRRWRERLGTAGIDPDTFEVVDRKRWALAWDHLKRENKFFPQRVENEYRCKWFVEEADELTPQFAIIYPGKPRVDKGGDGKGQDASVRAGYLGKKFAESLKF